MNLKHIGLALATLGTGVTLSACKKNKDATEVPGSAGKGGEGGCGGKAKKEGSCGGDAGKKEAGCGASAKAPMESLDPGEDAVALEAQGPQADPELEAEIEAELDAGLEETPKGPTDAKVEAMSDSNPLAEIDSAKPKVKKRRRRRRRPKKRRRAAAEEVCGEGTCG